ncbi:hypothetical protein FHW19_004276 [Ochrobactrum anthropi]|nr:hypothetical protein [Brucella anthropi]
MRVTDHPALSKRQPALEQIIGALWIDFRQCERPCPNPSFAQRWGSLVEFGIGARLEREPTYGAASTRRACSRWHRPASELLRPHSSLDRQTPDQAYFNALTPMMAGGIIEAEIHLAKRPKLFRQTEPLLLVASRAFRHNAKSRKLSNNSIEPWWSAIKAAH